MQNLNTKHDNVKYLRKLGVFTQLQFQRTDADQYWLVKNIANLFKAVKVLAKRWLCVCVTKHKRKDCKNTAMHIFYWIHDFYPPNTGPSHVRDMGHKKHIWNKYKHGSPRSHFCTKDVMQSWEINESVPLPEGGNHSKTLGCGQIV